MNEQEHRAKMEAGMGKIIAETGMNPTLFRPLVTAADAMNLCVACNGPAVEFKDEISRREYRLSGLCQICQDIAFAPDPDDADD